MAAPIVGVLLQLAALAEAAEHGRNKRCFAHDFFAYNHVQVHSDKGDEQQHAQAV